MVQANRKCFLQNVQLCSGAMNTKCFPLSSLNCAQQGGAPSLFVKLNVVVHPNGQSGVLNMVQNTVLCMCTNVESVRSSTGANDRTARVCRCMPHQK